MTGVQTCALPISSDSLDEACFAKYAIICPAATVHLLVLFSAGSLFSLTSPVMLKSATVSTSHSERGHKGTGLKFYLDFPLTGRIFAFDPHTGSCGARLCPHRQRPPAVWAGHRGAASAGTAQGTRHRALRPKRHGRHPLSAQQAGQSAPAGRHSGHAWSLRIPKDPWCASS